ncbi:MAG: MotA/TolQ/ExbB proton channel family protein [Azospirillaceae bacterium]
MSRPGRYLTRMSIFVGAVIVVCTILLGAGLAQVFMANPVLNGVIIALLLVGIAYTFRLVIAINPEVDWIENMRSNQPRASGHLAQPRLLAPLASMLRDQRGRMAISAQSMRSVLDGIQSRMAEGREISRYLIGLLIFLGLLGTFWGLLQTIGAVGDVIRDLSTDTGDLAIVFGDLQAGLEAPLSGMGTAFSSSLFGLAGSLILGFLELQSGQAQNRFYNDLEDWLSSSVRLTGGGGGLEGGDASITLPAYLRALVEQTSENMNQLAQAVVDMEERQSKGAQAQLDIANRLAEMTDQVRNQQVAALKAADMTAALQPIIARLVEVLQNQPGTLDEESRQRLASIDNRLAALAEAIEDGRTRLSNEVREDIQVLTRTIAAIAEEPAPEERE